MDRGVFLDRDGVINRAIVKDGRPYPPASVEEVQILPGAADAVRRLKERGLTVVVVTNQPDVARGKTPRATVEAINDRIAREVPFDDVLSCYHDDAEGCNCRKPRPGALLEGAARHRLDLSRSFMIGDRWRDIEAGQRAGVQCLFIDYEYAERQPEPPFTRVRSLSEAADRILAFIQSEEP